MEKKSLWAVGEEISDIRTPADILNEQAELLEKETKSILRGRILEFSASLIIGTNTSFFRDTDGKLFGFSLHIVAPRMNNYSYEVLRIAYDPLQIYPVYLKSDIFHLNSDIFEDVAIICGDEEVFIAKLETTLSSGQIKKVITNLVAQSKKSRIFDEAV